MSGRSTDSHIKTDLFNLSFAFVKHPLNHSYHFVAVDVIPLPPIPLVCADDDWTAWYDVDSPTGDGDFESLSLIIEKYPEMVCDQPTHVEGRVIKQGTDARNSGQRITLNPTVGLICRNKENLLHCLDYEVRFCCPSKIDYENFEDRY